MRTSGSTVAPSLLSRWAVKLFLVSVTRNSGSDDRDMSRSLEERSGLIAFPLSNEDLGGWRSGLTDPDTAPDVVESDDTRACDGDCGSGKEVSRVSCRSDLDSDLLRRGFDENLREFSIRT